MHTQINWWWIPDFREGVLTHHSSSSSPVIMIISPSLNVNSSSLSASQSYIAWHFCPMGGLFCNGISIHIHALFNFSISNIDIWNGYVKVSWMSQLHFLYILTSISQNLNILKFFLGGLIELEMMRFYCTYK